MENKRTFPNIHFKNNISEKSDELSKNIKNTKVLEESLAQIHLRTDLESKKLANSIFHEEVSDNFSSKQVIPLQSFNLKSEYAKDATQQVENTFANKAWQASESSNALSQLLSKALVQTHEQSSHTPYVDSLNLQTQSAFENIQASKLKEKSVIQESSQARKSAFLGSETNNINTVRSSQNTQVEEKSFEVELPNFAEEFNAISLVDSISSGVIQK